MELVGPRDPDTGFSEAEEAEYQGLLDELNRQYPPCNSEGFNFDRIRGNIAGRSAKAIILQLTLAGQSVADIADKLGHKPSYISRLLLEAIREAVPSVPLEDEIRFELAKMQKLERAAWEQFQRSCEDKESVTETEGSEGTTVSRKTEGQSGAPGYLKILVDVSKRRAELLGLNAPKKAEVTKNERRLHIQEVIVHTREDVAAAKAAGLLK